MLAYKKGLEKLFNIKDLDEIKIRSSQFLRTLVDRLWVETPNFSKEQIQLPSGFPGSLAKAYRAHPNSSLKDIVVMANTIICGKLSVFGRPLNLKDFPPWHEEVFHGYTVPTKFWKKISFLDGAKIGDSKIIWELNRLQFVISVAKAYFLTGDSRYFAWIRKTLVNWIESNPYPQGINWASSLELSFRVVVFDWLIRFCRNTIVKDIPFCRALIETLTIHGRHIERYLSVYFSPNTHLTGEALGLYLLGSRYSYLPGAEKWRQIGRRILLDCVTRHVLPDGGYFERSFWYHRYTLEIYLLFCILAHESKDPLPPIIREKVAALSDFLIQTVRDNGTFPLIGDDDGGRLLALDDDDPGDIRGLMAVVSTFLGRGDLKYIAKDHTEAVWWVLGESGIKKYQELLSKPPQTIGAVYKDTGYAFLRDSWNGPSTVISLDAGPHGYANCGHAHGDALSVTLSVGNRHIIIDPGTYSYTLDLKKRNLLRSPEAHSTLMVNGLSVSIPDSAPFHWKSFSNRAKLEACNIGWDLDLIGGCSEAYKELGSDLIHRRKLLFLKPKKMLLIWDFLQGTGCYEIILQYILASNSWKIEDNGVYSKYDNDKFIVINPSSNSLVSKVLEPFEISPGYMRLDHGSRLRFHYSCSVPETLITVIAWGEDLRDLRVIQEGHNTVLIKESDENIWCAVSEESCIGRGEPFDSDAIAACVISVEDKVNKAWALEVSRFNFSSNMLLNSAKCIDRWESS